jgi:hypothetical protein
MNPKQKWAMESAQLNLIRMSAPKLRDDSKVRLCPPLRVTVATATIAECLAAKAAGAGA